MSEEQLDALIISCTLERWQKTAMVISRVNEQCASKKVAVDYEKIAERIYVLAGLGKIEAVGDLPQWRHSEIRLPRHEPHALKD